MFEPSPIFSKKNPYEKPTSTVVKIEQESELVTVSEPQYFSFPGNDTPKENADGAW